VFRDEFTAVDAVWDYCESRSNGGDANPRGEPHPSGKIAPEPASDIDTRTVTVTFFPNKSAQTQRCIDLTLPQLAERILLETAPSKLQLPWLKLMTFGNKRSAKGCLRTNANAKEITGIEVEHDRGEISIDTAIAVLRTVRLRALVYTSPSYVPAAKEKWRILLPVSTNLPLDMRALLVARVNGLFDGRLAPESFVLSQAYLYGSVNGNTAHRVEVIDGDFIDLRTNLDPGAIGKSPMDKGIRHDVPPGPRRIEIAEAFKGLELKNLGAEIKVLDTETTIEEIRSAASAIPPSAIATEPEWMKLARALAWEARTHPERSEALWEILDGVSRQAPGYNEKDNQRKFDRYVIESGEHENPITIATLFYMAHEHGWQGGDLLRLALQQHTSPGARFDQQPLFDPWAQFIVPKFPLDVLPPIVREFVVSQAEVIGVDEASMAMCVLTTFSSALSHSFRLKMMRHGAWYVSPRLWMLLYGDASTKKTPAFNAATDPLEQYQKLLQQTYKNQLNIYEIDCAVTKEGAKKPRKPEPPIRFVVYDTTIEKLGELLARSERGLLVKHDEFAGWIGSMEKYGSSSKGAKADRAFWLKAYDGGPYAVDRIGRGEIFVDNLSVSLIGGVQPEKLAELHGLTADGLLQRFIPVVMGLARLPIDRVSDVNAYNKLVSDLIKAAPNELMLSDPALEVMKELHKHLHELACNAGGLARGFQSFVGKLQGMAGNLALILHMAADPEGGTAKPVGQNTMENVRKLVIDFILPHAFEFYRSAESIINGDRLKRFASWILTSGQPRFVVSDLTSNIAEFRGLTVFEVNERVSPLVAAGWIEPGNPKLGPANRSWNVNPAVFAQFETRVKEEEAIKTKLAELMNSPRRTKQ
jgi:hypothetical protein